MKRPWWAVLLAHARSRSLVVAGGAAVAIAWAVAPRPAMLDQSLVARALGGAMDGEVEPIDFVWEPSRGTAGDFYPGRGVVFLARHGGAARDAYRARVSLLPNGRPLRVRDVRRLSSTPDGDETDLVVAGGVAAFATRFAELTQSITVVPLGEERSIRRVVLPPSRDVAFELVEGEMVVAFDARACAVDLSTFDVIAGVKLDVVAQAPATHGAPAEVSASKRPPGEIGALPPDGYAASVVFGPGFDPAVSTRDDGTVRAVVLDGRQLDFALQSGNSRPPTSTGFVASGRLGRDWAARRFVFVGEIVTSPTAGRGGAYVDGHWVAPLSPNGPVLSSDGGGAVRLTQWARAAWDAPSGIAVEWAGDGTRSGKSALCVTAGGNLALSTATADSADPKAALPTDCTCVVEARGSIDVLRWGEDVAPAVPSDRFVLLASRHDGSPKAPPPRGSQWAPSARGQPAPAFLPAVHTVTVERLGTEVTVFHLDAGRFDWTLVAGRDEKSPRQGGALPATVAQAERPRARIAFGLGYAKRRALLGLRIDGSTGHPFVGRQGDTPLVAAEGALFIPSSAFDPQSSRAATELPITVDKGRLDERARERGPRQLRGDLCALPSGEVLVAQAVFDSQEATASALVELGCVTAVALDRGTEQPTWVAFDEGATGPFSTTALVGLARPLAGNAIAED